MSEPVHLTTYYVDLHVHIGRTMKGRPIKITGAKNLTFRAIAEEASERKGMDIVGIIDCHSPSVQEELDYYLDIGDMIEVEGGGIRFKNTTILLGSELEVVGPRGGEAHVLIFFPTLEVMREFTSWLTLHLKNVHLSSQKVYVSSFELQNVVQALGGTLIPAHVFTPHKGMYGRCVDCLEDMFDPAGIHTIELGLSADKQMAEQLQELHAISFVSNSDAHSLGKIGREYNEFLLAAPTYAEVMMALRGQKGRKIIANYGLDPKLGKYYLTHCLECDQCMPIHWLEKFCGNCSSNKITFGVAQRLTQLGDVKKPIPLHNHPPYYHQIPLEFIPGIGPKTLTTLLSHFGTEMNIIHHVPYKELVAVVGEKRAEFIQKSRDQTLEIIQGGGGTYGKIQT